MTEPLLPITFPYLTTLNLDLDLPLNKFADMNSFSAVSFVEPYKFNGDTALSVLTKIVLSIFLFIQTSIIF